MAKVKCKVCANETGGICNVKKIGIKINKDRSCEAYIYDEGKVKAKQPIHTTQIGYRQLQESKRRTKEELKALKRMMKKGPSNGTAESLGLLTKEESRIIQPGDPRFSMPKDMAHPLTGDLSRFTTTAKNGD